MRDYFLRSSRLGFGIWRADDLQLALGLWGDADVTRLLGGPFTADQVQQRLARELTHYKQHGIQYWPLFLLESGEHVGCCGLRPRAQTETVRELGYQLRPAYWGKGYAREAANAAITHAFTTLGLSGLHAGHHPNNHSSQRILEGLGFHYTHHEIYPPTGQMEPCYALQRSEYRNASQS